MKVHTIPGVGMSSNSFLVESGKSRVLVDAGWDDTGEFIIAAVSKLLKGSKLDTLLLTHRHIDHVGGATAIVKKFKCDVLIHEEDAAAIEEGDEETTGAAMFGGRLEPLDVKRIAEDDEVAGIEVMHTPGHTIGSICLYDEKTKTLISGDTVFSDGVGRWDLATGDVNALLASLKRVAALEVEGLYPGHGRAVEKRGSVNVRIGLEYLQEFGGL